MTEKRNIQIALPDTGEDEWRAVREPLMTGWLTQGPKVAEFEKAFAACHSVTSALATTNCTAALHLILAAMEIGPGDEVILPSFAWIASANVVTYCGATPVLVDVDRATFNIDPADVARKLTGRTKAIIAVHLFGLCADIDAIAQAAPGVTIIEDAACAAGAVYKGASAGSLGAAGAFSFHPRKSITTGEGGMAVTNDAQLAERMNMLRNHGASVSEEQRHNGPRPYLLPEFNLLGFNYRMTDLQGAVGLVQLGKLDRFIAEREKWAEFYEQQFADIEWLQTPRTPEGLVHARQAYVCYVDPDLAPLRRNELMDRLAQRGVSTRPGTHAVHMLGYYKHRLGLAPDDLPASRDCDRCSMAIPLHNRMSPEDYQYVSGAIREIAATAL
jgi:perosamine synthetase